MKIRKGYFYVFILSRGVGARVSRLCEDSGLIAVVLDLRSTKAQPVKTLYPSDHFFFFVADARLGGGAAVAV